MISRRETQRERERERRREATLNRKTSTIVLQGGIEEDEENKQNDFIGSYLSTNKKCLDEQKCLLAQSNNLSTMSLNTGYDFLIVTVSEIPFL
jgi:hypothetical protein